MRLGSLRTIDDIKSALAMRDNLDADDMWRIISALCDVVAQQGAAITMAQTSANIAFRAALDWDPMKLGDADDQSV